MVDYSKNFRTNGEAILQLFRAKTADFQRFIAKSDSLL